VGCLREPMMMACDGGPYMVGSRPQLIVMTTIRNCVVKQSEGQDARRKSNALRSVLVRHGRFPSRHLLHYESRKANRSASRRSYIDNQDIAPTHSRSSCLLASYVDPSPSVRAAIELQGIVVSVRSRRTRRRVSGCCTVEKRS